MMTEYTKTKAFLTALELDDATKAVTVAIRLAKYNGRKAYDAPEVLEAMKRRDLLTYEYSKLTEGRN